MRAIRTALLLTTGLTLSLPAAPAHAADGPGVIIHLPDRPSVSLTGAEISAMARDPRTYTLPASDGRPSSDVVLSTVRVFFLLVAETADLHLLTTGQIFSADAGPFDVNNRAGYLSDDGHSTRYFSDVGDGIPVEDYLGTADPSAPLQISWPDIRIPVSASATPRQTTVGQTVTFQAQVRFALPGTRFGYQWQFGDGQSVTGDRVTHVYDTAGSMLAVVSARNLNPDCVMQCHGVARVSVQIGKPQPQPKQPDPTPGGTSGAPQAPGAATGTRGSGQGDDASWTGPTNPTPGGASPTPQARGSATGTDGSGQGDDASRSGQTRIAKPSPKPAAASDTKPNSSTASRVKPTSSTKKKHPFGTPISGVLINDPGTVVRKVPSGTKTWAPKGIQPTRGGQTETQLQLSAGGLLALVMILLGALRERRNLSLHAA